MTAATTRLVGQRAGGREHIVATASLRDPVLLVPEPTNAYDRHAIAVYTAPRRTLLHPTRLVSSIKADDGIGKIDPEDRLLMIDRQAGYVGREVAATLSLPAEGIVGYVSEIRYAPTDYDLYGEPRHEPVVAGFDVAADLTRWRNR